MRFEKKILDKKEIEVICEWVADSTEIKKCMWEFSKKPHYMKSADILFNLFDKYDSNVEENTVLYRGIALPNELYKEFSYHTIKKGDTYTPDDKAVTSFTRSKHIAYTFAEENEFHNKIIIKVFSHGSDMFDISMIPKFSFDEEETIIMKNICYNVRSVKRYKLQGGITWLLLVLEKA